MRFSFIHSVFSFVCSFFRSFDKFSKDRSRRCDDFGPKIVKIGAILAIFRPLKKKEKIRFFFRRWCPGGGVCGSGEFGRFGNFADFSIFLPCRGARDLSHVRVSALYDASRPKTWQKTETLIF